MDERIRWYYAVGDRVYSHRNAGCRRRSQPTLSLIEWVRPRSGQVRLNLIFIFAALVRSRFTPSNLEDSYNTIWTYPWDLIDEGPAEAVHRIKETGLTAVSLTAAYHSYEMLRPHLTGKVLLRSPRASLYFQPCKPLPLDPLISPLMGESDWWSECSEAISEAGLELIAWTVFLHNSELALRHPECAQVHATGDVSTSNLCPANPEVRSYAVGLAAALSRYGISVLECESLNYGPAGHTHHHAKVGVDLGPGGSLLHSLCFCGSCRKEAEKAVIDFDRLKDRVDLRIREVLLSGEPCSEIETSDWNDLPAFVAMRERIVATLVAEIKAASGTILSFIEMGPPDSTAAPFESLRDAADRFEILAYTSDLETIERQVREAAQAAGGVSQLTVGLRAYPPATRSSEELVAEVRKVRELGVSRISFYNYGIMPYANLEWIKKALR